MSFTPPKPKANTNEFIWATYIPDRSEKKFKIHRTLAHARAAISSGIYSRPSETERILYRLVDNEWVEEYHFPIGTIEKDLPWKKNAESKPIVTDRQLKISRLVAAMKTDEKLRFWDVDKDDWYSNAEYESMAEYLLDALER